MTSPQHPITPPPELRQLWAQGAQRLSPRDPAEWMQYVSEKAAQWGADQELEACCRELAEYCDCGVELTSGSARELLMELRRPKPPSLAEEALALVALIQGNKEMWQIEQLDVVRRALERLQQLENQQ